MTPGFTGIKPLPRFLVSPGVKRSFFRGECGEVRVLLTGTDDLRMTSSDARFSPL